MAALLRLYKLGQPIVDMMERRRLVRVSKRELSLRGMIMDHFCVRAKYGINNRQIITIGDFPSFPSVTVTDAFPPHRRSTRPPRRRSAPPSLARGHDVKRG